MQFVLIYYAGIGSRETPEDICNVMSSLANMLSERRLVLRSGGARGADISFEKGVTLSEIFLTDHKRINGQISYYDPEMLKQASEIASKFHPVWGRLDEYSKKLHTRNTFQILGEELKTPHRL